MHYYPAYKFNQPISSFLLIFFFSLMTLLQRFCNLYEVFTTVNPDNLRQGTFSLFSITDAFQDQSCIGSGWWNCKSASAQWNCRKCWRHLLIHPRGPSEKTYQFSHSINGLKQQARWRKYFSIAPRKDATHLTLEKRN